MYDRQAEHSALSHDTSSHLCGMTEDGLTLGQHNGCNNKVAKGKNIKRRLPMTNLNSSYVVYYISTKKLWNFLKMATAVNFYSTIASLSAYMRTYKYSSWNVRVCKIIYRENVQMHIPEKLSVLYNQEIHDKY